jgi:hypothetical protein
MAISVVCRLCRRPLEKVVQTAVMVHYRPCPRHPGFHTRYDSDADALVKVPHKTAADDAVTVGVLLAELDRARRARSYAV